MNVTLHRLASTGAKPDVTGAKPDVTGAPRDVTRAAPDVTGAAPDVTLSLSKGEPGLAVLEYEARRARDVALVVGHGYSSSKQNLDGLCAFLASHGFSVYSLDFPGHKLGASGGRLRGSDLNQRLLDRLCGFERDYDCACEERLLLHSVLGCRPVLRSGRLARGIQPERRA